MSFQLIPVLLNTPKSFQLIPVWLNTFRSFQLIPVLVNTPKSFQLIPVLLNTPKSFQLIPVFVNTPKSFQLYRRRCRNHWIDARRDTSKSFQSISSPTVQVIQIPDAYCRRRTIAGYRAVLLAARWNLPVFFRMLIPVAGTFERGQGLASSAPGAGWLAGDCHRPATHGAWRCLL